MLNEIGKDEKDRKRSHDSPAPHYHIDLRTVHVSKEDTTAIFLTYSHLYLYNIYIDIFFNSKIDVIELIHT